jgi:sulfotransferase famil protein
MFCTLVCPMIISHGRKYIFVHIPKTGGTSLSLALEDRAMKDDILIGDTPKAKNRRKRLKDVKTSGRLWKHARLRDVYGLVTQDQIESYFVFTIVRNPWDRMVSYYHWLKVQNFDHPAVKTARTHDFTGFLSDPVILRGLQNDATCNYVSDQDGVNRCDMYLRMDHLSQDAQKLEQHLGVKLAGLPHENPSQRDVDYTGYYDAATKAIIATVFAEDIGKFNYKF